MEKGALLDTLELTFMTTLYKTGTAIVTLCSGDLCIKVPTGTYKLIRSYFAKGYRNLSLIQRNLTSAGVGQVGQVLIS